MSSTPEWLRRAAYDRADGVCEAMCSPGCGWFGTDVHHRQKRSQGGEHALVNALWVCRSCHEFLESNPARSYEVGYLVHGWDEPTWPPRMYRGRWLRNTTE